MNIVLNLSKYAEDKVMAGWPQQIFLDLGVIMSISLARSTCFLRTKKWSPLIAGRPLQTLLLERMHMGMISIGALLVQ